MRESILVITTTPNSQNSPDRPKIGHPENLLVAQGVSFAIFWNNELLSAFQDSDIVEERNYFTFSVFVESIKLDNISFWNPDGVKFPLGACKFGIFRSGC